MAHAGGRPTKLNDELIAKARQYVDEMDNNGVHVLLPTIERLALILDIHRDTLYDWADRDSDDPLKVEFSDILNKLLKIQADKLLQNALVGRYNPVITKLMLSKHGYIEKREDDITSGGEKVSFVNAIPRPDK